MKASKKTDIYVYADWVGLGGPKPIGILTAQQAKGRKAFSFAYDKDWIQSQAQRLPDPDIQWFHGAQHRNGGNFGVFMDSMPDTWGKRLMVRRSTQTSCSDNGRILLFNIGMLIPSVFYSNNYSPD